MYGMVGNYDLCLMFGDEKIFEKFSQTFFDQYGVALQGYFHLKLSFFPKQASAKIPFTDTSPCGGECPAASRYDIIIEMP
ncbi:hypothetical protein HCR_03170 [Hydrogenimonas cancrithermarum]|uniref:Transcriptional regulator, AsnC family n=1 Tax=Hydrogenimonas cancrithermarum TaxID=2993563 RepID=A0ABN6WS84_9BACT|nr:hypothetical protein HCR_03170 [Hydrogenimonas cancrithermarum]